MARPSRKLCAILSADVVGYSRLMQSDEAATVGLLKEYRTAIGRIVERHKGRVVNAPGDALLAEFPSAVEAVEAAVEIQHCVAGRNLEIAPERRMQFRIGANLGDVIEETDGTLYGDGVNIAARMESLAEAGGICVSGAVHEAVDGKIDVQFESLGPQQVKNISKPIDVYKVRAADARRASPQRAQAYATVDVGGDWGRGRGRRRGFGRADLRTATIRRASAGVRCARACSQRGAPGRRHRKWHGVVAAHRGAAGLGCRFAVRELESLRPMTPISQPASMRKCSRSSRSSITST